ncbi:MAG: tail fiber domain-containing protein [Candidatus Vogelbacteria bacterium]|nr:tail fiber domain-containing protein [Candidatus Vogelbacteria bacterium]
MTIYTAASTPPGQSSVTVRATGGGITRAASPFTLTVSAPSAGSYTISGSMGSGGTMGITGAQGASCTRSSSNYTCSNIPAGSSPTITPSRSGYTFSPTSRNFPSISSDKTGQNFTATASGGTGSIDSFIANPSSPTVNQSFLLDWATTGCASVTVGRMTPTQTIYLTRSTNVDGSTSVTETTTGTKTYEIDCLSSTASTATVLDQRTISVTVVGGGGGPIIIPEADCTAPATVGNWTEPVGTPPANNTFPPVTVSAVSQIKAGCVSLKALGIGLLGGVAPLYSLDIFGGAFIDGVMNVTGDLGVQGTIFGTVAPPVSDASLKTNISTLGGALAKILNLRGVSFDWIDGRQPGRQIGVVAQEVEKVYPEVVSTNNAGMKSVNYSALIAPLIEAVKEQQILINNLQSEVKQLKLEVSALRKQ